MTFVSIIRIATSLVAIIGGMQIIPLITAICCHEYSVILPFVIPMACSAVLFLAINIPFRGKKFNLNSKTTFIAVAVAWISACFYGSFVIYFSGAVSSYTDAFFESASGFSTTGATVIDDVESLPRSINLWRCMTHWLGGMGIVALTVALLPLLGVGGFQLIKAETSGPEKGKITPKIATTAKYLWFMYMGFTAVETVLLMVFGMDFIDALSHAFSTLGTGGFSTRNSSIGYYNSLGIEIVITVFMFLAGINFSMYYYALTKKFRDIRENSEFKCYLLIVFVAILVIALSTLGYYGNFWKALRYSSFQVLSILTTAGFGTSDYTLWPSISQFIILFLFFVGGSSGSTAGGIKIIRWVVLGKLLKNETKVMLHPQGIFSIRLNNSTIRKEVLTSVVAFMVLYLGLVVFNAILACIAGFDLLTAFSLSASMVGNIGPAFGQLGPTQTLSVLPAFLKWFYSFAMLAGRLELYTMIIFFMPEYWRNR